MINILIFIKKIAKIFSILTLVIIVFIPRISLGQNIKMINQEAIKDNKVISIFSLNVIYNNINITKRSSTSCALEFYDDYKQKTTNIVDKNNNYVVIYSNPGKVYLDHIKCNNHSIPMIYGKSRFKKIDDWAFVAYNGFINYVGEINIKFYHDNFKFLDLINMSGNIEDKSGVIQIDVKDKLFEAINYIKVMFENANQFKISKSLLKDSHSLRPNENKEIFDINGEKFIMEKNDNIDNKKALQESEKTEGTKYQQEKNQLEKSQTINLYEISKEENNNINNTPSKPSHPYLAPIYSEFYMPNYNPYLSIGDPFLPYNHKASEVVDPAIENHLH